MERPKFKPVFGQSAIALNKVGYFWTALSSTYTRFKNGEADFWVTITPDFMSDFMPEDFKSTNNGWWVRNRGNSFHLPEFGYNIGRGHCYGKIEWTWRCRKCQKEVASLFLDLQEICADCNHGP